MAIPPAAAGGGGAFFLQLPHDSSSCSTPRTNPTRAEARGHHGTTARRPSLSVSPTPLPSRAPRELDFAIPPYCSVLRLALPQSPSLTKRFCTGRDETERGIKSTGGSRNTPLQRWERTRVECTQESGPPRHTPQREGERSSRACRCICISFSSDSLARMVSGQKGTDFSEPPQPPASCPLQFVRAALPAEGARDPGGAARGAREE
jgi:hypothetical protein